MWRLISWTATMKIFVSRVSVAQISMDHFSTFSSSTFTVDFIFEETKKTKIASCQSRRCFQLIPSGKSQFLFESQWDFAKVFRVTKSNAFEHWRKKKSLFNFVKVFQFVLSLCPSQHWSHWALHVLHIKQPFLIQPF